MNFIPANSLMLQVAAPRERNWANRAYTSAIRIAVIADIHGSLLALEAVLGDIATRAVDLTVNLGDLLSGALQPGEMAERLMELDLLTVRGNHERQLLTLPQAQLGASDTLAFNTLTVKQRDWLTSLPATLELLGNVLLVHGSPTSDLTYLLESIDENGVRPATVEEVTHRLENRVALLVLCGHTHMPRALTLPGGALIVNPGSVGLPAYEDDTPFLHVMEAGTPHARYAIVDDAAGDWIVEQIEVAYDWEAAARMAEANGRSDAAQALRTGYTRPIARR